VGLFGFPSRLGGIKLRSITVWMLGGVTDLEGEPSTAGADFRIAVAPHRC
jgi:hypothetical protein